MFETTYQYLISALVWLLFFCFVYFGRDCIKKKLRNIESSYNIKLNWIIYSIILVYLIFTVLNIMGVIQHKIIPVFDYLIIFLVTGFIGPVAEEFVFRGFFLGFFHDTLKLKRLKLVFWFLGVNIFFALIHNVGSINPKSPIQLLRTFLLGIIVSLVYLGSKKNILYPLIIHLTHNMITMYFILN